MRFRGADARALLRTQFVVDDSNSGAGRTDNGIYLRQ
jgi:hypothetical protein